MKVVHRIPGGILVDVLRQQGPLGVFVRRGRNGDETLVFVSAGKAVQSCKNDFYCFGVPFLVPGVLLARLFGIGPVFELDHQRAIVVQYDRLLLVDDEIALGGFGCLDVAVFPFGGVDDAEVHETRGLVVDFQAQFVGFSQGADFRGLPEVNGVVLEVLGGLDVVLIRVGPVQLHFLAVVGHGERRGFPGRFAGVVAPRNEVAVIVVPFEEAVETVVNLTFNSGGVLGGLVAFARLLHHRHGFGIGSPVFPGGFDFLLVLGLELGLAAIVHFAKGLANDGEQVVLEETRHLLGFRVHDAVEPEVKIGLIQLEQLLELVYQSGSKLLCCRHIVSPCIKVRASEW